MDTYKNSFYENDKQNRSEFINCDKKPIEYKGFLIYHRWTELFDIVKNGVCVGMYAGINGAKKKIDQINGSK